MTHPELITSAQGINNTNPKPRVSTAMTPMMKLDINVTPHITSEPVTVLYNMPSGPNNSGSTIAIATLFSALGTLT
jgi:hypothetical protein